MRIARLKTTSHESRGTFRHRALRTVFAATLVGTMASVLIDTGSAFALNSPTVTAVGPATDTIGGVIATTSITSVLTGSTVTASTITFTVFGPSVTAPTLCTGGTAVGTAVTTNGDNTYHPNATFTPATVGHYWWYASFAGDAGDNAENSTCGSSMSETVVGAVPTVTAVTPSTDTVATAIAGTSITSVVTGSSPTGTLTFYEIGPLSTAPTSCPTSFSNIGTATVSGNGTYSSSGGFTPGTAGNYWIYVTYSGDTNNNAAASTCGGGMAETSVGTLAPTVTTNAATSVSSSSVVLNGTINPNDGSNNLGTVYQFQYGTTTSYGTSTTSLSAGGGTSPVSESVTITGLTPSTAYDFRFVGANNNGTTYGGNLTFTTLASAPVAATLAASGLTTTAATLNGTVDPYDPTNTLGTTYYFEYGTDTNYTLGVTPTVYVGFGSVPIAVAATITGLNPNTTYDFQLIALNSNGVTFGGDQTLTTSAVFSNTSTSLAVAPTTVATGATTVLTATVSPVGAVGSVEFFSNGAAISSCTAVAVSSSGIAQCNASFSAAGGTTIVAIFSGSTNFGGSTSAGVGLTVSTGATTTTLKLRKTKVPFGKETQERFTVTVKSGSLTPTGTVVIKTGTKKLCTVTLSATTGSCVLTAKKLAVGTFHPIATYSGSTSFATSASAKATLNIVKP